MANNLLGNQHIRECIETISSRLYHQLSALERTCLTENPPPIEKQKIEACSLEEKEKILICLLHNSCRVNRRQFLFLNQQVLKLPESSLQTCIALSPRPFELWSIDTWLSHQQELGFAFDKNTVLEFLRKRGFSQTDLIESSMDGLVKKNPVLMVHIIYEALKALQDMPDNTISQMMASIAAFDAQLHDTQLAHFIWVGPPQESHSELAGVYSLHHAASKQRIKIWVLEAYVDLYQKLFMTNASVQIQSIETYAQKLQSIFADGKTLLEQIHFYRNRANKAIMAADALPSGDASEFNAKILLQKDNLKTGAIQDRVQIVNYMKCTIPLYEGGWVFDCNVVFYAEFVDAQLKLPITEGWLCPLIATSTNYKYSQRDVWFFHAPPLLNWKQSIDLPNEMYQPNSNTVFDRSIHIGLFHQWLSNAEKLNGTLEKRLSADYWRRCGTAILQLVGEIKSYFFSSSGQYEALPHVGARPTSNRQVLKPQEYFQQFPHPFTSVQVQSVHDQTKVQLVSILSDRLYKVQFGDIHAVKFLAGSYLKSSQNKGLAQKLASMTSERQFKKLLELYVKYHLIDITKPILCHLDGDISVRVYLPTICCIQKNPKMALIAFEQLPQDIKPSALEDAFYIQETLHTFVDMLDEYGFLPPSLESKQPKTLNSIFARAIAKALDAPNEMPLFKKPPS